MIEQSSTSRVADLQSVETTLTGTRVYPLMSRGELLGVLVCGDKRDHQGFAPDENDALFTMARGAGSARFANRAAMAWLMRSVKYVK